MKSERIVPGSSYTAYNTIELVKGGSNYFDFLVQLIEQAKETIHLQIYIYEADETGQLVTEALMRAARRGVKVFILLDGYASRSLKPEMIMAIRKSGIYFRWFEPLFKSSRFYIGRRMHHKVLVVDGSHSLVGGINISNHYNDRPEQPAWLDWAVYMKGEISTDLYNRCVQMWFRVQYKSKLHAKIRSLTSEGSDCYIRMRINDWVRNRNQISRSYIEMFHRAQSQITILSSYFLPGNIEIYEYRKKVLHGKIATYDGQWVTVGSYNFNTISAYASLELNVDVHNQFFAKQVDKTLNEIILTDCDPVTSESFAKKTNLFDTLVYRLSYESVRFIFFLFTFYFKREKN
jgi:cardiolipin synthase A/B